MHVYHNDNACGFFRTFIDDNYSFTEAKDEDNFTFYSPPKVVSAYYANENEIYLMGSSETDNQYSYHKDLLLKFDYTAGKVYYWRL